MHVQDEERRRIARELHDEIGQQLAGLKMVMVRGVPSEALGMVDSAISSVRNLSYLLHPPLLDETGLRASLHWLVDGVTKRSGIQFSIGIKPDNFPRLALEVETTIFRLVQEAVTNVYRHSQSDRARVEIEAQTDWIAVRVRDYGSGITVDPLGKPMPTLGVGISGMKERVRQFGGELLILPAQPGTLVEAKIPLFS
jgi:two-component system, NarL family, sensor kinase